MTLPTPPPDQCRDPLNHIWAHDPQCWSGWETRWGANANNRILCGWMIWSEELGISGQCGLLRAHTGDHAAAVTILITAP